MVWTNQWLHLLKHPHWQCHHSEGADCKNKVERTKLLIISYVISEHIVTKYNFSIVVNSTVSNIVKRLWERFIFKTKSTKKCFVRTKTCVERGGFVQHQLFVNKGVGFTKPSYTKMCLKYCLKVIGDSEETMLNPLIILLIVASRRNKINQHK